MKPATAPSRAVRFGLYEVDLRSGELRKQGLRLRLQEKPFQILSRLLEHPGEVVTREELRQVLWPADTFVDFDNSLNAAINKLREALGDSADRPRYVETVPRRGYRFIYPVDGVNGSFHVKEITSKNEVKERSRPFRWIVAVAAVAVLAATLFVLNLFRLRDRILGSPAPRIQSLAVLPLTNLSGDTGQEYFSDGMTDALITDLAQMGSIRVISRTSSMQYKQTKKSLPEIARELKVDGLVEGTIQRSGDRVRITAQLVHGPSDKHLWANSYERDIRDVFMLERDVAGDVARHVQERLTAQNRVMPVQPRPLNPSALEAYLQGNYHLNRYAKGFGDEAKREASEYFQQAINSDQNFAPAHVALAESHLNLLSPLRQDVDIAKRAAERAVALDPNLSEAHEALGEIKFRAWDWSGAEQEYRQATALNWNSGSAHESLAVFLDAIGRLDEGWREGQVAQELDPTNDHLSDALMMRGQYDRAIEIVQMMLKRYPEDGYLHWALFNDYAVKGMDHQATLELEQVWMLVGFPQVAANVRSADATSGYRAALTESAKAWERLIVTNQAFAPVAIAGLYATLADKDRAFYWLEQAYKYRDRTGEDGLEYVRLNPTLDPLRSDPRYKDLLRRMGLPP